MWYLLTGSLPSMASSQSFLLASEKACNVMIPCLWTINILHKSICKTHTYIWTVMWFPCASDSREIRQAAFRRPQKADLGVRFPNCDVIWSQKTCIFFSETGIYIDFADSSSSHVTFCQRFAFSLFESIM